MSSGNNRKDRPFDILVYGATGFAGKHVVKHFFKNHPTIKIAIAGRNQTKLSQLATDLNNRGDVNINADSDADEMHFQKHHLEKKMHPIC